jgi:hypothetical protein
MVLRLCLGLGSAAAIAACSAGDAEPLPWMVNRPLVSVRKSVYQQHLLPKAAALVSVQYVGPGLQRREVHANEVASDVGGDIRARWSEDNGRTWSAFAPMQPSNNVTYAGVTVWEGECCNAFDATSGLLVQLWLRQIEVKGIYHCFTYVRTSTDAGRTWSTPEPLRYEDGDQFDPAAPLDPAFLNHNEGYPGNSILRLADGSLVVALAHANAPGDPKNDQRPWRMGSVLFRRQALPLAPGRAGGDRAGMVRARADGARGRRAAGWPPAGGLARLDARLGWHRRHPARPQVVQPLGRRRLDPQPGGRMAL